MKKFEEVNLTRLNIYLWIVLGHVAFAYLVMQGELWLLFISVLMHYLIYIVGISMTYHRAISHRSVTLPKWLEYFGVFVGGLGMQGSALSWAASHRQHHKYLGTTKDPHSPRLLGSWYIHLFGYTFRKIDMRLAGNLLKTYHVTWHRYYYWIYLPIIIGSLLILPFNWSLAIFWAPIAIAFQSENLVGTWTHDWKKDTPIDVPFVNLFVLGEAFHEHHHAYPQDYRFHKYDLVGIFLEKFIVKK